MNSNQILMSLGTNVGQRRQNLRRAVRGLQEQIALTAVSPVYETEPWGLTDQPDFLNLCLAGYTTTPPKALLSFCKNLEDEIGREPTVRWGPRLIDIDLLFYDDLVLQEGKLTIPHPRIDGRAFVLIPLADIAPDFVHPQTGETIAQMATAVDPSTVRQLSTPLFANEER